MPLLLRELLNNLVDNAIKYTPPEAMSRCAPAPTDLAVLEVEDDGIGIPVKNANSIFERFYRVLGTDAEGSGLGLPIAAEIAELHQARIDLLPGSDGRGSLFRVSFPRHRGARNMLAAHQDLALGKFPDRPVSRSVSFPSGLRTTMRVILGQLALIYARSYCSGDTVGAQHRGNPGVRLRNGGLFRSAA